MSKSRLAAFLSEDPRRNDWYTALAFSDQVTFGRALEAREGQLDTLLEEEQFGYTVADITIRIATILGAAAYLGVLFYTENVGWIIYLLLCIAVAFTLSALVGNNTLAIHLRKFSSYSRQERVACVGQMKFYQEFWCRPLMEYIIVEAISAPVLAPLVVFTLLVDDPFISLGLD